MVSLRTARLLLRPWEDDDVAAFIELSADPAVVEFLSPLSGPGEAEAWVGRARDHWRAHGFGQWVVEIPGEARFIGVVGLRRIAYEAHFTPAVEVAWRLARAHWGRGFAVEAARAALDYGFGGLGLDEIVAVTTPSNLRSRRVMERLGMSRLTEDDFDHPDAPEGPLKRCMLYRLKRAETTT
ncbi:MAG TPA: GNAT family N-acetyltransferase [Stellaceae bacterium]|jgi:ribosomal-protein-alanine N-acetyltransferase|nr:GNAT family N-acetyltransferase [Stellaceae bacterium]